jgi:hypothetical protein
MKVAQGTVIVVLTLGGLVIFGPFIGMALVAAAPQIAQMAGLILGGAALLTVLMVAPQV